LDLWLVREDADPVDATEVLRGRALNNLPVLESVLPSR